MTHNNPYPITAETQADPMTPADARALSVELAKVKRRQALFHRGIDAAAAWLDEPLGEEPQR